MSDSNWVFLIGILAGVFLSLIVSFIVDVNQYRGCEKAVNESCVRIGWVAESHSKELKKMQNIKHPEAPLGAGASATSGGATHEQND